MAGYSQSKWLSAASPVWPKFQRIVQKVPELLSMTSSIISRKLECEVCALLIFIVSKWEESTWDSTWKAMTGRGSRGMR
jgi:hypothetical protein